MTDPFRVYLDPAEIGLDGYPYRWHKMSEPEQRDDGLEWRQFAIKDLVRERDGHRCLRCHHPYRSGEHGNGQWSLCDEHCAHFGPIRTREVYRGDGEWLEFPVIQEHAGALVYDDWSEARRMKRWETEAEWRILTVHHLNGVKHDCRWWNLVSLCQRCHLSVQTRVVMDRPYDRPHSEWFRPFVAAFYAWKYLDKDLARAEVDDRLDELLALEQTQDLLF